MEYDGTTTEKLQKKIFSYVLVQISKHYSIKVHLLEKQNDLRYVRLKKKKKSKFCFGLKKISINVGKKNA